MDINAQTLLYKLEQVHVTLIPVPIDTKTFGYKLVCDTGFWSNLELSFEEECWTEGEHVAVSLYHTELRSLAMLILSCTNTDMVGKLPLKYFCVKCSDLRVQNLMLKNSGNK